MIASINRNEGFYQKTTSIEDGRGGMRLHRYRSDKVNL
jgi:hypothetical protein